MRLKIIAAVAAVAVVGGSAGIVALSGSSKGSSVKYLTATAERTTVSQEAVATGSISAATTYGLAFGEAPQIILSSSSTSSSGSALTVETLSVKVGDAVNAGQTLANLFEHGCVRHSIHAAGRTLRNGLTSTLA